MDFRSKTCSINSSQTDFISSLIQLMRIRNTCREIRERKKSKNVQMKGGKKISMNHCSDFSSCRKKDSARYQVRWLADLIGKVQSSNHLEQEGTVEEPTALSIRYPINCPEYDWSKDEYHSASKIYRFQTCQW